MESTLEKLVTDITICIKVNVTDDKEAAITEQLKQVKCKVVEVKNRSGVDIFVIPNNSSEFPLTNGEDRVIMVKSLEDLKLFRQTGTSPVIVHLIIEN